MKATRHGDLFTWNAYQPDRHIDFNGFYWRRPQGGVLFDPMPLRPAVLDWLQRQPGSVRSIVISNADHLRAGPELGTCLGASLFAPRGDREALSSGVDGWYDESTPLPAELGLEVYWIHGGKTEAEAVIRLPELDAVLFGDVVRSDASGVLRLLPSAKLRDEARVCAELRALAALRFSSVLLGDGDSLFTGARAAFDRLLAELPAS